MTTRPNIIVIVIDDLRWDELGVTGHPYMKTPHIDRLAHEGARFTHAFHTTPLCSPNRACILTGQYASRHGIIDNVGRDAASHRLPTYPLALQKAGYETAHVGKWHMGNDASPRPGNDYWVSFRGQGQLVDPELQEDDQRHVVRGYVTDLLNERALAFVERPRQRPFALYLAHKAVHPDVFQRQDGTIDPDSLGGYVPAQRHRDLYRGEVFPPRPNVLPPEVVGRSKPALAEAFARKGREPAGRALLDSIHAGTQEEIRLRAAMMASVDEGVGMLLGVARAERRPRPHPHRLRQRQRLLLRRARAGPGAPVRLRGGHPDAAPGALPAARQARAPSSTPSGPARHRADRPRGRRRAAGPAHPGPLPGAAPPGGAAGLAHVVPGRVLRRGGDPVAGGHVLQGGADGALQVHRLDPAPGGRRAVRPHRRSLRADEPGPGSRARRAARGAARRARAAGGGVLRAVGPSSRSAAGPARRDDAVRSVDGSVAAREPLRHRQRGAAPVPRLGRLRRGPGADPRARRHPHYFDDLAPALRDRWRVIAYARRGHGRSEARSPYDADTLAEDLGQLLDALGLGAVHLAGWSLGGRELTRFAELHPARVRTLIYLDGAHDRADPAWRQVLERAPLDLFPDERPSARWTAYRRWWQATFFAGATWSDAAEAYMRDIVVQEPDGSLRPATPPSVFSEVAATYVTPPDLSSRLLEAPGARPVRLPGDVAPDAPGGPGARLPGRRRGTSDTSGRAGPPRSPGYAGSWRTWRSSSSTAGTTSTSSSRSTSRWSPRCAPS